MRHLVAAEFLRLASRRLTIVVVVLTIASAALQSLMGLPGAMPLSEAEYAQARADLAESQRWHEEYMLECERDPVCDPEEQYMPVEEDFLRWVVDFDEYLVLQFEVGGVLLLAALAVWVAVMVGADFRTGSLATQLTFTPQRMRVLGAKVFTSTVISLGLVALATVVAASVSVVGFVMVRSASGLFLPPTVVGMVGRLFVSAIMVAVVVGLVAMLTGSTVATIVVVGGVLLASVITASSIPGDSWLMWALPSPHLEALFSGSYHHYWYYTGAGEPFTLVFRHALSYFAVLIAVVGAAAALRFQRRDLMI